MDTASSLSTDSTQGYVSSVIVVITEFVVEKWSYSEKQFISWF